MEQSCEMKQEEIVPSSNPILHDRAHHYDDTCFNTSIAQVELRKIEETPKKENKHLLLW